jgi:hypothetical protein
VHTERTRTGISNHDGFNIGSGDGFYARLDPADSRTAIIESQDGRANRVNLSTLERQAIAPLPPSRLKPGEHERWNWNAPIVMSTFDPRTLYMGSHMVFKSTDRGATWKAISPDLTAAIDRESLQMMGAPVPERALSRHDGVTSFSTLTTIGESPLDAKLIYAGSDDGRLTVTRDGGEKWSDLNERIPGLPATWPGASMRPSMATTMMTTMPTSTSATTTARPGDRSHRACPPRPYTSSGSTRETGACCSSGTSGASISPSTAARTGRR